MRASHLRDIDVLGSSMGGFIAQDPAVTHPNLVRKLVLASTEAGGPHSIAASPDAIANDEDLATTPQDQLRVAFPPNASADANAYTTRILTRMPLNIRFLPRS
jgi:pimeloyl-ACP methyl ester carboxylesterase